MWVFFFYNPTIAAIAERSAFAGQWTSVTRSRAQYPFNGSVPLGFHSAVSDPKPLENLLNPVSRSYFAVRILLCLTRGDKDDLTCFC